MVIHPTNPAIGFAVDLAAVSGDSGVYRSDNLNAAHDVVTWTRRSSGITIGDLGSGARGNWMTLVMDRNDPNKLYLGTQAGLYYTRNALGACDWNKDSNETSAVVDMALSADGSVLLYARRSLLRRVRDVSTGSHADWTHDTVSSDGIEAVAFEPNGSTQVWIGVRPGTDNAKAVQKTDDIGAVRPIWTNKSPDWYHIDDANALLIADPASTGSFFFGASCNALWTNNP